MATIDIRRAHALATEDARRRVEGLAAAVSAAYQLDWRWRDDQILFEASRGPANGLRGSIDVTEKEIRVQADLPFLLRLARARIDSEINAKLDAALL
jgi:putative polyhydroxyalkanoate system protein